MSTEGLKAAADLARHMIALSTGAIAFTITFLEKFTPVAKDVALAPPPGLYAAWLLFGATIVFATWSLMAITGSLDAIDRKTNGWPMTAPQISAAAGHDIHARRPALLMIASFVLATGAMIWTGFSL